MILGIADSCGGRRHPLYHRWEQMIYRCFSESSDAYYCHGNMGVRVCEQWLVFDDYVEGIVKLPGYDQNKISDLELDKDKKAPGHFGLLYAPEYCSWLTRAENEFLKDPRVFHLIRIGDGRSFAVSDVIKFCRDQDLHPAARRGLPHLWEPCKPNAQMRYGFRLERVENSEAYAQHQADLARSKAECDRKRERNKERRLRHEP